MILRSVFNMPRNCLVTSPDQRRRRLVRALVLVAGSIALACGLVLAQSPPPVPAVYANIAALPDGQLAYQAGGGQAPLLLRDRPVAWTLEQLRGHPRGTETGLALDFQKPGFAGSLVFGLIPYHDTRYPLPVFRATTAIKDGKAEINIKGFLSGMYDPVDWEHAGRAAIGYRVLGPDNTLIYDGRIRFKGTGPFETDVTLVEGPFVANVTPDSAVIWFELDRPAPCAVRVGDRTVPCRKGEVHQEITVDGLPAGTEHRYTVRYGENEETYAFRTAPKPGTRKPFVFGYASDCRGGPGGEERSATGPNAYIMRRLVSASTAREAAFLQFTGDLVTGSNPRPEALSLEYANWKRVVEPYAHYMPIYTGIGNHEVTLFDFIGDEGKRSVRVPRFPFATESAEAVFARALVNPDNGPVSEDGASYDPNPAAVDFPPYRENVYWYAYDNVAMVVLSGDYWYTQTITTTPGSGGNLHGYLMDNQIAWLGKVLDTLERTPAIDHVFLTVHTPVFPNGGHVGDDMWYRGNNTPRPTIAGKPVGEGIIERRDDLLRLVQAHRKVLAVLTGDEHNYNRLELGPGVNIYPEKWDRPKVTLRSGFFQINNGAAGAPYYAQDLTTPWGAAVKGFSTQNAVCFFLVDGPRVRMEVQNPETLEVFDRAVLR
jgi:hypothetical protein